MQLAGLYNSTLFAIAHAFAAAEPSDANNNGDNDAGFLQSGRRHT